MASPSQLRSALTLEEFLRLPEIDEHPYLEFIDGRIEAKVSPQKKHSVIQKRLMMSLDSFSQARGLGETFPELRCTFAGRSLVPDLVFLTTDHIQADSQGDLINETFQAPTSTSRSRPGSARETESGQAAILDSQPLSSGLADRSRKKDGRDLRVRQVSRALDRRRRA